MRITRSDEGPRLRLDTPEGELLVRLFTDAAEAMRPGVLDPDDAVQRRLFPDAYPDDPDAERGFRELTEATLREERIARAEQCAADVATARSRRNGLELVLDQDAATRWLQALNDLRLALGTRLEISEDDDHALDPDDPDVATRAAYGWLTAVQDSLVHVLTP